MTTAEGLEASAAAFALSAIVAGIYWPNKHEAASAPVSKYKRFMNDAREHSLENRE